MTAYRIEFGPAWPVPPITLPYTDPNAFHRAVAAHAIPHLKPVLAAKGHPEYADCFFRVNPELTAGEFWYLDLPGGNGARFGPARLIPVDIADPDICGDENDGDWCELEPGHEGHHRADTVEWAAAPACRRASLFLGTGGYPTCSNADCTEPDAASTVLEQYANEAHAPEHTWAAELYDPLADEWVPGTRYPVRERAVNHLAHARTVGPTWKDGSPTRRRLVRATTTYTVEPETEPAAEAHPESCAHCGKDILRVTGTLAVWWVHDPGGNTICFPQQAASSPRATPKPAAETQPAEQPFDRCAACGHTVCDGDGPCGARSGDDFCTCPGPAAEAQQEGAAS